MLLWAAGDIHGALGRLYDDVVAFEVSLDARVDGATHNHEGAGDFSRWLAEGRAAPRPTLFIKGNHEDFDWLEGLVGGRGARRLPRPVGPRPAGHIAARLRAAALHPGKGGARSGAVWGRRAVLHDAPAGIEIVGRYPSGDERRYRSEAVGLAEVVSKVKPAVCFFGHHHRRVDAEIDGVRATLPAGREWPAA